MHGLLVETRLVDLAPEGDGSRLQINLTTSGGQLDLSTRRKGYIHCLDCSIHRIFRDYLEHSVYLVWTIPFYQTAQRVDSRRLTAINQHAGA
jgi:hypothetical protein